MLAIDIVKPEPVTELEAWLRWANRMQAELLSMPYYHRRKIEVKYIGKIDCSGQGRRYCEEQGEHSWFNHAMDNNYGDLPEGFIEP